MVSPLRKAREEVAVNIAVTGFVSRLLPTETRNLTREMEALQKRVRDNRGTIADNRREMRRLEDTGQKGTQTYSDLADETARLDEETKGLSKTIQDQRVRLSTLASANTDALNKVRGFGIVVGVGLLTLGAFGAGAVKVASDMRELEIQSFRTGNSVQSLHFQMRSFAAGLGDTDLGKSAAQELSELQHQFELLRSAPIYSNPKLYVDLALAGISPSQVIGQTQDAIRTVLADRLRVTNEQGDVQAKRAIESLAGSNLFAGLVADATSGRTNASTFGASPDSVASLRELRMEYGRVTGSVGGLSQVFFSSLAPSLKYIFRLVNWGTDLLGNFIEAHRTTAVVIGSVIVVSLTLIVVFGSVAVTVYTVVLAKNALAFSLDFVRLRYVRLRHELILARFWLAVYYYHTIASIKATSAWGVAANVTGASLTWLRNNIVVTMAVMLFWKAQLAIVTAAQWAWNTAMYANPIVWVVAGVVALTAGVAALIYYKDDVANFFSNWDKDLSSVERKLKIIANVLNIILGHRSISQGVLPPESNSGTANVGSRSSVASVGGRTDIRENVTFNNNYNITGVSNSEEVAEQITRKQQSDFNSSIASRSSNFVADAS